MDNELKMMIKEQLQAMSEKEKMAFFISFGAHQGSGQKDKGGRDYINHPLTLCARLKDENARIVALLHDVMEDTSITEEQLSLFFDKEIIDALKLLTHDLSISYEEYINKIKTNPLATKVKIEDLKHNMDINRIPLNDEHIKEKIKTKYKPALEKLLK